MVLDTESDVNELEGVQDREGDTRPAANADEQEKTNDRLGNFSGGVDGEETDDTTGSTLPAGAVPEGVQVAVQAKHSNDSRVKIGLTDSPTVEIKPGRSASFRVSDSSQIHIVAKSDGDGVNYGHEVSDGA